MEEFLSREVLAIYFYPKTQCISKIDSINKSDLNGMQLSKALGFCDTSQPKNMSQNLHFSFDNTEDFILLTFAVQVIWKIETSSEISHNFIDTKKQLITDML